MGKYFCEACKLYDDDVSVLRTIFHKLDVHFLSSFFYRLCLKISQAFFLLLVNHYDTVLFPDI